MSLIAPLDIVQKSIDLYKENRDVFAQYLKFLFIPSAIIVIGGSVMDFLPKGANMWSIAISLLILLPASVVSLWLSIGLMRAIADRYAGIGAKPPATAFHETLPVLWPLIIASILNGLAVLGGFILLIIPGIIFSIWFSFTTYAVVLDNARGTQALSASKKLVQGRWWAVLVRLFVPGILFALLIGASQGIVGMIGQAMLSNLDAKNIASLFVNIVFGLFTTAITIFLAPLATGAQTILYTELKKTPVSAPPSPAAAPGTPAV